MITDKLGQPINVGDFIAYGHALGRCAGLRIGKVLKVQCLPRPEFRNWGPEAEWKITVWGVADDWQSDPPTLCKTKGILGFPNRIVVLQREQVPAAYRDLLDPVPVIPDETCPS